MLWPVKITLLLVSFPEQDVRNGEGLGHAREGTCTSHYVIHQINSVLQQAVPVHVQ